MEEIEQYTCQGCFRVFPKDKIKFFRYEPIKAFGVSVGGVPMGEPIMETNPKTMPFCIKCYDEHINKISTKLKNIGRKILNSP